MFLRGNSLSLSCFISPNLLLLTPNLNLKATPEQKDCLQERVRALFLNRKWVSSESPLGLELLPEYNDLRLTHPSFPPVILHNPQDSFSKHRSSSNPWKAIKIQIPCTLFHLFFQPSCFLTIQQACPTPATLVIPLLSPHVYQPESCLAFSILTKWLLQTLPYFAGWN